jgi:bifunctional non-homologous end joining protein LigD
MTHARFAVQKHWASRLHYDFRLEVGGALASWAVPKGPSLDPAVRRLAVRVEDHSLDYLLYEGGLPEGEYGAGTVIVWDHGQYAPEPAMSNAEFESALRAGRLRFALEGRKLRGLWALVRFRSERGKPDWWLLRKLADSFARSGYDPERQPESSLTGRAPSIPPRRRIASPCAARGG